MQNNFCFKPKFNTPNTISKRKDSVLFLDYLEHFISNSATKRVQGYGTVGLAKNTIRTYNSLHRVVKDFEFAQSEILYINTIDKYTAESFTHFLKIDQQYSDNYCGQLLKLLKVILRDAVKSGLEVHPYSNYIESFKQKSSDRILHILNPTEIKALCKMARKDRVVSGFKNKPKTRRKEIVDPPKYEFLTSHIMRRSFAYNYYGKIETPLLMNITGHSKESTFLTYMGTHQNKDALADLFMYQAGVIW